MSTTISTIGVLIGFTLLTVGAWKKINLIPLTLLVSALIGFTGGLNVGEVWSGLYMEGFIGFAGKYLLLFCFGALFGKILEDSGASWRISNVVVQKAGDKWALAAYVGIATLLIYGGVSIFVVIFILLPIAKDIFKNLRVPWSFFPGLSMIAAVGAIAIPGSLQILNIIPTRFLGTDMTAGLGVGIFGSALFYLLNAFYYKFALRKKDEIFDAAEFEITEVKTVDYEELDKRAPNIIVSIIPIVLALVLMNVLKMDIILGFLISCIVAFVLFFNSLKGKAIETLNVGMSNGVMPLVNVSVVVGLAKTVAEVPFFEVLKAGLVNMPFSGLMKASIVTNVIAFFTGSASGSMTMILDIFGQDFIAWGTNPDTLHRVLVMAAQGMDSMPWCSVIVMFLSLTGVSYSRGYKHMFFTTVIATLTSALAMILVAPIFG